MKRILLISISVIILGGVIFSSYSCKQASPPKAVVLVVDEAGKPVEEARVVVRAPSSDSSHTVIYTQSGPKPVADTKYTDRDGKVFYSFKYEAIYRVEVSKGTDRHNPFVRRGLGVLILENDKTYEAKITINEQTVF